VVQRAGSGSSHVKVTLNGIILSFKCGGKGKGRQLQNSDCKLKVEAFKAMGIAWDARPAAPPPGGGGGG
jgi:hypothetical protein